MLSFSFKKAMHCRKYSNTVKKSIGIIGVPFSKGQTKSGVEDAPEMLRNAGLISILKDKLHVKDYGNLHYKPFENNSLLKNVNNCNDFLGCSVSLIQKTHDILKDNDMFLTIGGDHAIGFGSVAGHLNYNPNISLIWIDAHPDINLNITSVSGNTHGMPVAFLIKELRKFWMELNIKQIAPNCLPAKELVYIGLRDIDPKEAYILQKLGINFYAMDAVDKFGIAKIMEMSLDGLNPANKLHISFDIDALDVTFAPSTGTAVLGGLTLRESVYLMEQLYNTSRVQGVDIVEVNPRIGTKKEAEQTLFSAIEIIKSICGHKRCGTFNTEDKINWI